MTFRPNLNSTILKVTSQCNINCTYCYMYNLDDKTYKIQPPQMSVDTINEVFDWVERYVTERGLRSYHLTIHGGEPLLAGKEMFHQIAARRDVAARKTGKPITLSVQTNALLLDEGWIETFHRLDIRFGISLDGPQEYHDRFRLTRSGQGTHARVEEKLRWILSDTKALSLFSGILCVIHPAMDGRKLLRYFYELGVDKVDFLLPDQNHDHGAASYPRPTDAPTYGLVLGDAYRAWREIDSLSFRIRKFCMLIEAVMGRTPTLDSLGTGPITVFTVETNGEVEPVDTMKACGHGYTKSGLPIGNVQNAAEIEEMPLIHLGLRKKDSLPERCRACPHQRSCGGGYLPHRFSQGGFDRETVYCADMYYLCDLIRDDVLSAFRRARAGIGANAGAMTER